MDSQNPVERRSADHRVQVCFVCSGNICRSPMAEVVFRSLVADADLGHIVVVDSAGTGEWHIGERADRRTVEALKRRGYDGSGHRARQFEPDWFRSRDLVVALDRSHLRTLSHWAPTQSARERLHLLRSFDPTVGPDAVGYDLDVRDPYYDGPEAFSEVLATIESACQGLLQTLVSRGMVPARPDRAVG